MELKSNLAHYKVHLLMRTLYAIYIYFYKKLRNDNLLRVLLVTKYQKLKILKKHHISKNVTFINPLYFKKYV